MSALCSPVVLEPSCMGLGSQGWFWQTADFLYRANAWKNPIVRIDGKAWGQGMKMLCVESEQHSLEGRGGWDFQNVGPEQNCPRS